MTPIELIFFLAILFTFLSLFVISVMRWVGHSRVNAIEKNPEKEKHYRNIVMTPIILTSLAFLVFHMMSYLPDEVFGIIMDYFLASLGPLVVICLIILGLVLIVERMRKK